MTGPTRDVLTPADLDAILRGGGSAEEKLQRAAMMALEKRAMGKDLLTEEEISKLVTDAGYFPEKTINSIAINAARLGAERARERAAMVCEAAWPEMYKWWGDAPWRAACEDCAAAIRRGEGEQA